MAEEILEVEALSASYGPLRALRDVSLVVAEGEIVVIAGHNGAGKSTLLKTVMGMVTATSGRVRLKGVDVTRDGVSQRVAAGLCLVPQQNNTFGDMSISENLEFSARLTRGDGHSRELRLRDVYELFPDLWDKRGSKARSLSGGQRQMLAIGISLVKEPSVLLLDEPSIGLAPVLVERVFDNVASVNRDRGTTVLVVEQNINEAFRIASRAYIMHLGSILATGEAAAMLQREDLFTML